LRPKLENLDLQIHGELETVSMKRKSRHIKDLLRRYPGKKAARWQHFSSKVIVEYHSYYLHFIRYRKCSCSLI